MPARRPEASAFPETEGFLAGLEFLGPLDLPRYKRALSAGGQRGWGYYLPYLLTRNRTGKSAVLWCEDEGTFCVFLWRVRRGVPRLELPVAPAPMSPAVLRRCLQRCNDFNGDHAARVLRIDERDAPAVASLRTLRVAERRSQYLYSPADLLDDDGALDLSGRRYRTVRRNYDLVAALPELEVARYAPEHEEACRVLLADWGKRNRAMHGTTGGVGSARRALELVAGFSEPDLIGEVILLEGRLVAFALGGEMSPGVGCFFEAKCDADVRGLSYFQRARFLARLGDLEWVNDGSDVGRAGLRQLKQSLRPRAMHLEFRGTQEAPLI